MISPLSMKSSPVCRSIQINGKQHYLWRAVDQDGEVVDVYLQPKRDGAAADKFFKRLNGAVAVIPGRSSRISYAAMESLIGNRSPNQYTSQSGTRIIGLINHMSQPGSENGG